MSTIAPDNFNRPQIHQENLITLRERDPVTQLVADEFTFRINPDQLTVSKPKIEKYTLTKIGYERQFWGNDLQVFQYSGLTGAFRPDEMINPRINFDITQTRAWIKFKEFERFYERQGEGSISLQWWGDPFEYIGSLPDFNYRQDAAQPFYIRLNFKIVAVPRAVVPVSFAPIGTA